MGRRERCVYVNFMCRTYFSERNSAFSIHLSSTARIAGEFSVPRETSVMLLLWNILVWDSVQNVMRLPPPPPDAVISLLFVQDLQDHWKECEQWENTGLTYKKHELRSFSSQIDDAISWAQQSYTFLIGRKSSAIWWSLGKAFLHLKLQDCNALYEKLCSAVAWLLPHTLSRGTDSFGVVTWPKVVCSFMEVFVL